MSRKAPPFPDSLRSQKFSVIHTGSSYTIDVITALFGGGVTAAENDPVTLVRVPAIRGHLRFWWRATRGARFENPEQLAEREGQIWGTTTEPSRVQISAEVANRGKQESCDALIKRGRHLGYALFPFREAKTAVTCTSGIRFKLNVNYAEDLAPDVKAAIWAWVNFGGIGSRTRRGCGALFCKEMAPASANQLPEWLKTNRVAFQLDNQPVRMWPTLGELYVDQHPETPEQAWTRTVSLLHKFRQGDIARGPFVDGKSGPTLWPEVDSLRSIARQGSAPVSTTNESENDPAFPRARLGLPIIFHFIDSEEEFELSVAWKESTRMASPLILRPLLLREGTNALPMIARLRAVGPPALKFSLGKKKQSGKKKEFGPYPGKPAVLRPDLAADPKSPLHGRSKEGSALIAFLALAKKEGFKEVG